MKLVKIRKILKEEMKKALELVWKVFLEYEAPDYTEEGIKEFKKTIVELYENGNKNKSELAREYGTSEENVRAWIKKYVTLKTSTGETTNNDEILKLKKENQEIKTENEILKKALAIFSRQQKIK